MFKIKTINIILLYFTWIALRHGLVDPLKDPFYVAKVFSKGGQFIEPGILFFMLVFSFRKMHVCKQYLPLFCGALMMLCAFVFSFLINQPLNILNAIMFFFGYFGCIGLLLFTIAYNDRKSNILESIFTWYVIFIIFQFMMNFGWYFKISPFKNDYRFWENSLDWAFGTLMGCVESAGISSIAVFCALYLLIHKPEVKNRIIMALSLFFLGFIQIYWADSKLSYLSIFASTIAFISILSSESLFFKIRALVVGMVAVFALFWLSNFINEKRYPQYGSTFNRMSTIVVDGYKYLLYDNPKVNVYNKITKIVSTTFPSNVFGQGPGNFTSRFAQKNPSDLTIKYWEPEYEKAQKITNSVIFNPQTAFLSLLGDVGWAGVILYYSLSLMLLLKTCINFKRRLYRQSWKIEMLAFSYCLFSGYFIIHSFIDDNNYMGIQQAYLWVVGTLLYRPEKVVDKATDPYLR